jgi:nitroimidazol reductase NimA-like FMN-containing flavoprotein (pyridoxamine 5'-phosphate oxidase superfamily)
MTQPSTRVTRLTEKQDLSRSALEALLDATPLVTVALVRDGHPVIFPTGFARVGTDLVIHGSTGSPWLRALSTGLPAAVSVTTLDGVVVARSGFESSFQYRSAALFGVFETENRWPLRTSPRASRCRRRCGRSPSAQSSSPARR